MWGGRFSERPDAIMEEINVSIDVDRHMYAQDIAASKAHAAMLAAQGIITANDAKNIAKGLDTILSEIAKGSFDFKRALEDIHMNVESRLSRTDRACRGAAAHRALAQRPGGDRFPALCPRHHRRDRCGAGRVPARAGDAGAGTCRHRDAGLHPSADRAARDVRASSARLCRDGRARPRPLCRCAQAARTNRRSAPQRLPAPRSRSIATATAKALGFDRPMANSLDAVSDRDFVLETLSAASIAAVHLSRFAEEIVIWTSPLVGLVRLIRQVHHRLLDHAAEAQPGCGRTGARQDRPGDRRAHRAVDRDEGPAARLSKGHAGGQAGRDGGVFGAVARGPRHDRHGRATSCRTKRG